jgi:hypothetical protein
VHAVISIDETMDLLGNLLVSNISLLRKMLEVWVVNTIDGVLFSWVWSWVVAVVSVDETMDLFSDILVSNISIVLLGKRRFVEPLPCWVLETIDWVCFSGSSPWLWQD